MASKRSSDSNIITIYSLFQKKKNESDIKIFPKISGGEQTYVVEREREREREREIEREREREREGEREI